MVHTSAQRVVGDSLLGGISETMKTFLVKKKRRVDSTYTSLYVFFHLFFLFFLTHLAWNAD